MCGIAGIVDFGHARTDLPDTIRRMTSSLAHRGPDEFGYHLSRRSPSGIRRLSIIDLATGQQPLSNEDGSVWVVFNGEIYNFAEVRKRTDGGGPRLPHPQRHGDDRPRLRTVGRTISGAVPRHVCFCVCDQPQRSLFLARDRFGKKPLFYAQYGNRFVFASEMKAILVDPAFPRDIDARPSRPTSCFRMCRHRSRSSGTSASCRPATS